MKQKQSGFTLIELAICIAIIAVMAAVVSGGVHHGASADAGPLIIDAK